MKQVSRSIALCGIVVACVLGFLWLARHNDGATARRAMSTSNLGGGTFDCGVSSYYDFVRTLMQSTIGDVLADAVYDPEIFNSLARSAKRGWEGADTLWWKLNLLHERPVAPLHFNNVSNILWWTKRLISVGFGRLHRDAELEALMRHSCHSAVSFRLFEQHVRRTIESLVGYFHTVLQLAVDTAAASTKRELLDAAAKLDASLDPLVLIATTIGAATSIGDVAAVFQDGALSSHVAKIAMRYSKVDSQRRLISLFFVHYDNPQYVEQNPVNGKFWNMIRPTTTCSSFVRLCELPDGCRLICNAEYLLFAGTGIANSMQSERLGHEQQRPYAHRASGFGGNNEYDWELSLLEMFTAASKNHKGHAHSIGWLTSFDCTLTMESGPRQWAPPKSLIAGHVGYGYSSVCVDGNRTNTSISLRELKGYLGDNERDVLAMKRNAKFKRHTTNGDARPVSEMSHRKHTTAGPNPVRLFDAITILKTDVEGYEYNMIPSWARDELRNIAQTTPAAVAEGATSIIDFEVAANDYLSVSLYSMEFHRAGHSRRGYRVEAALRAHYTLLHIYSLGFVMTAQEKNHFDDCCYELVWVSQRHFVRSEMWMVARDDM